MNFKGKMQRKSGITLISLVVTIIVLLILAGVTIATLTGENGILSRAQEASENTKRANAEEQVKLAVAGSIGTDGEINIDNLNAELSKIEGITSGLPIKGLPATLTIERYQIIIGEDGNIKESGKWSEATNEEGEIIITDGTTELRIGDYINYDPTNEGSNTTTYVSPQGTYHSSLQEAQKDTNMNMEKGNGYKNQVFSVTADTKGWRVLGLNEDTHEILLISAEVVKTESSSNGYFYLRGQTGAEWGVKELNDICAIYGEGKGANGARSINIEDIDKITGYIPEIAQCNDGEFYEYGNEVTYTRNAENISVQDKLNNKKGISETTIFKYLDEKSRMWKKLEEGESKKIVSNDYYYFPNTLTTNPNELTDGIEIDSIEYQILFSNISKQQEYWLASNIVSTYFSAGFGIRNVNYDKNSTMAAIGSNRLFYTDGETYEKSYGVRPVVFLDANVSISGGLGTEGQPYQIQQ